MVVSRAIEEEIESGVETVSIWLSVGLPPNILTATPLGHFAGSVSRELSPGSVSRTNDEKVGKAERDFSLVTDLTPVDTVAA